jgi:hypothetical protein
MNTNGVGVLVGYSGYILIGGMTMTEVIRIGGCTTSVNTTIGAVGADVGVTGGDVGADGADVGVTGGDVGADGADVGGTSVGALVGVSGIGVRVGTGVTRGGVAEAMTLKSGVTVG